MVCARTRYKKKSGAGGVLALLTAFWWLLLWPCASAAEDWVYTVRPGDNLWDITREYLRDISYVERLQALNTVPDPKLIPPGTRLRLPIAWLRIQPMPAYVHALHNNARVVRAATDETEPLVLNAAMYVGDMVYTGPDDTVTFRFADGSQFLLLPDSRVRFDTLTAYGKTGMVDTRLRLLRGRGESRVERQAKPASRFEISTPAGTSSVRGTRFRVGMDETAGISRVEVTSGVVTVRGTGKAVDVPVGSGTLLKAGEPPAPLRSLLPAPDINGLPTDIVRTPFRVEWPVLKGASAYRLQIVEAGPARTVRHDALLTTTRAELPGGLANGEYVLRVRGIDADGLEGLDADHPFKLAVPSDGKSAWPYIGVGLVILLLAL